jgi:hypothetical protein
MAKKYLPDIETLRQLLWYETETGKLYWLPRTPEMFEDTKYATAEQLSNLWNFRWSKKEAGTPKDGYIALNLNTKKFNIRSRAHRIIWKISFNEDPPKEIDHINGNRSDNRIQNLRAVTRSQNNCNSKTRNNFSGVKGIDFCKRRSCWRARIAANKKIIHLGEYKLFDEALAARKNAEIKYHGEFARKES